MERGTAIAIAAIAIGIGVFGATFVHATLLPGQESEAPQPHAVVALSHATSSVLAAAGSYPERLIIPKIGVNAYVQRVGLGVSGNMAVPTNFTDVAWYKWGPLPGQLGSAVMDGHVDNGLSLAGVFKHLSDISVGDDLYVQTMGGKVLHFKVSDVELYPYQDVPTQQIFNQTDVARLNLITCDGAWVGSQKTYDHRLVIYTTLVSG